MDYRTTRRPGLVVDILNAGMYPPASLYASNALLGHDS